MLRIPLFILVFLTPFLVAEQPLLESPALRVLCQSSDCIVHARVFTMGSRTKENGIKTYDVRFAVKKTLKGKDLSDEVIRITFDAILPSDVNQRTLYTTALERRRVSQLLFLRENLQTEKTEDGEVIEKRTYRIIDGWFGAMPFSPELESQIVLQLQEINKS